jgi:type IV pilus assembly protein PilV
MALRRWYVPDHPMTSGVYTRRSHGFTLLEVLVSLFVLSIGLLGVGKLMLGAVRSDDSAFMRTQATALAYEILDAMRANRPAAQSQGYDTTQSQFTTLSNPGVLCDNSPSGTACTDGDTLAQYDLWMWKQRMIGAAGSPGALPPTSLGSVTTTPGPNSQVVATITVQWDDSLAQQTFNPSGTPPVLDQTVTLTSIL